MQSGGPLPSPGLARAWESGPLAPSRPGCETRAPAAGGLLYGVTPTAPEPG